MVPLTILIGDFNHWTQSSTWCLQFTSLSTSTVGIKMCGSDVSTYTSYVMRTTVIMVCRWIHLSHISSLGTSPLFWEPQQLTNMCDVSRKCAVHMHWVCLAFLGYIRHVSDWLESKGRVCDGERENKRCFIWNWMKTYNIMQAQERRSTVATCLLCVITGASCKLRIAIQLVDAIRVWSVHEVRARPEVADLPLGKWSTHNYHYPVHMHAQQGVEWLLCLSVSQSASTKMSTLSELGTLVAFSCNVYKKNEIINKCYMLWKVWLFALCPNYQTEPHLDFNISYYYLWQYFILNKVQSTSNISANSTVHGISALLGTSCFATNPRNNSCTKLYSCGYQLTFKITYTQDVDWGIHCT